MYTVWLIKYLVLYTLNSVIGSIGKGIFSTFWQFVHNFLYIQYKLCNVVASEKTGEICILKGSAYCNRGLKCSSRGKHLFQKRRNFFTASVKKTDCEELNKKCIKYASTNRVCFFESDPGNFLFY